MNKKTTVIIVVLIIIIGALFFFQKDKTPVELTGEPIRIGVIYSQTGAAAGWGERGLNAAQMAVDDINNEGGVNGKPLELIVEDGKSEAKSVISAFTRLTALEDTYVIMGDVWNFLTEPLVPLSKQHETVLISPTVMNATLDSDSDFYFSTGNRVESIANATEKFFETNADVKSIYMFCWSNTYGEGLEKVIFDILEKEDVEVVGKECSYFGEEYRTQAAKVVASKADAVIMITSGPNAINALRNIGYEGKILATSDMAEVVINKQVSAEYSDGLYFIDWPSSDEFISRYQELYNQYPIYAAHNSYNLIRVIAEAYANDPTDAVSGIGQVSIKTDGGVIDFKNNDNVNANRELASLFVVNPDQTFQEVK